jgi:hypothetical protein
MKRSLIPLSNRVQAIETILDSLSQRKPDMRELKEALQLTRSVQRSLFGPRYVTEHSLIRFSQSDARLKKKANWGKVRRERAIAQNGRL